MSTTDDARAEAERAAYAKATGYTMRNGMAHASCLVAPAEWQASRKVEAAPSDTDREALAKLLAEHRPSVWRSFSNDATVLRCCGIDFGRLSGKARKTDRSATELWEEHLADALSAAGFSRTPQPVQVEITEEMVERAARALNLEGWTCSDGEDEPGSYLECSDCKQVCDNIARAALTAALGGGDHAE